MTTELSISFRPYQFRMEEIEAFRYRARDAWRAVTRIAIREARLQEIKAEMMKSKQLKVISCFCFSWPFVYDVTFLLRRISRIIRMI
jgi:hypothetical protein